MLAVLAVAAASFALDYVWVFYTRAVARDEITGAVFWSGAIMLLGGVNIAAIASDWHLVIAAAFGAGAGTYCAMRRNYEHETSRSTGPR